MGRVQLEGASVSLRQKEIMREVVLTVCIIGHSTVPSTTFSDATISKVNVVKLLVPSNEERVDTERNAITLIATSDFFPCPD